MKRAVLSILILLTSFFAKAQSKIFKEVSDEISSQVKAIWQDNALVGYLVFTQLEKASEDSFNYKISIMDENLNDVGSVNFTERNMVLQDVSLEQDVLCIAYLKGDFAGSKEMNKRKDYREAAANKDNEVFMQYLSLNGKILKTNSFPVTISFARLISGTFAPKVTSVGYLKHNAQIKNIPKRGFAFFYGDEGSNYMMVFDTKGDLLWKKEIKKDAEAFYMLTDGAEIYLLLKKSEPPLGPGLHWGLPKPLYGEGGYELLGYTGTDTTAAMDYTLLDQQANQLKVVTFENDPVTGKPYAAGLVIDPKSNGYLGVFTIDTHGIGKAKVSSVYTYWDNDPLEDADDNRKFQRHIGHTKIAYAFKDFDENTYFTGTSSSSGFELIKQNKKGSLQLEEDILSDGPMAFRPVFGTTREEPRYFYRLLNNETKTNYLIVDDEKHLSMYNVDSKKVVHSVPSKEGSITRDVFPAKEGYVMITEYNKKEKYTKVSIEAL